MSDQTSIGWADATWPVVIGCERVSPGCVNCYAERTSYRLSKNPQTPQYVGLTVIRQSRPGWTGEVRIQIDALDMPLGWRRPRWIFPCSQSDLFHESVPFTFTAAVFGVMQAAGWHTFLVTTKRPKRALEFAEFLSTVGESPAKFCRQRARDALGKKLADDVVDLSWPPRNVYVGVSVESPAYLPRIETIRQFPAALHWASFEPLLARVDVSSVVDQLGWGVVGGESGPKFRPCEPEWIVSIAEQFRFAGRPIHVKQDSAFKPEQQGRLPDLWWAAKDMPPWPLPPQGTLF